MTGLFQSVLIFGLVAGFGLLHELDSGAYYQNVQEDQPLEWATFWAFMIASGLFARAAWLDRSLRSKTWFIVGLAAFCFVVAMEEISWGQRLLGYETPRYFLEYNYQKELNFHNVVSTDYRKLAVAIILAGYGLLLPLLARFERSRALLDRLHIEAPPIALTPAFLLLLVVYVTYPWRYSGEVVEAGMSFAFLFAAFAAQSTRLPDTPSVRLRGALATALCLVVTFGFGSALWSRDRLAADPALVKVAETEIEALERDVRKVIRNSKKLCGKHERLTHFATRRGASELYDGGFTSLVGRGLPEERAEFFIDPWSTAYWVRTTCNDARRKVFVYSFGPNRRRDSSRWKRRGDDIGTITRVRSSKPSIARSD